MRALAQSTLCGLVPAPMRGLVIDGQLAVNEETNAVVSLNVEGIGPRGEIQARGPASRKMVVGDAVAWLIVLPIPIRSAFATLEC